MNKFTVENLNLYYGDFHALKNVSIDIPANEITAFIGPSGCGKSTFLKTLNRMNDLVDGVRIEGQVLVVDGPLLRKVKEFPFSAAFLASVIVTVHFLPAFMISGGVPDDLGIGTNQEIIPPAFQFLASGGIYYFIIFPIICNPHIL